MTLYGNGRAALAGDRETAGRLGWPARRRSRPEPEIVLRPRDGDPTAEPWIAPPRWHPRLGLEPRQRRAEARRDWTYLPGAAGLDRYLERLAAPQPHGGLVVGLAGLGRVGGAAATLLAAAPVRSSGIRELRIHDADAANQQRWVLELGSIAVWRDREPRPAVRAARAEELFDGCDAFLFAPAAGVPPLGSEGDVRLVQFEPNRAILRPYLDAARAAGFTGLFLIVSDPVEGLAQAAFHDSNLDARGGFDGRGLAPERVAGLGLGVMWARALAEARRGGFAEVVAAHGAAFGPHSAEVLAFDDVRSPDAGRSARLTRAARECNLRVRELGYLPYVGPGVSSVALALPRLLAGRETPASVLTGGIYFGMPARCEWAALPSPRRMAAPVWCAIGELHARMRERAGALGLRFGN
ncbi:MAG TPA: hypothetical protein VLW17_06300 [Thermoanaerobaculaceae bacterium]|nr:hypothetical protein [Thermoanaerobaculaceae bacterium]